jgi:hypothetical protein
MPNYVYSNPYADAAQTLSGGATTLGQTVLHMALLRQQQAQQQQAQQLQLAQLAQQQNYQQQNLDQGQQRIDLERQGQQDTKAERAKEFGLREREGEQQISESQARVKGDQQRLEDAMRLEFARRRIGQLMQNVGQPGFDQQLPMQGPVQPGLTLPPAPSQMQQLQQLGGETLDPQKALELVAMLRGVQSGNPQVLQSLATGFAPSRTFPTTVGPQQLGPLERLSNQGDPNMQGLANQVIQKLLLQSGATNAPPSQSIYAVNPQTKQRVVSTDGGKTWQPTQ